MRLCIYAGNNKLMPNIVRYRLGEKASDAKMSNRAEDGPQERIRQVSKMSKDEV